MRLNIGRNLVGLMVIALFAIAGCSDDPDELSGNDQNDLNVGEQDTGVSGNDGEDDAGSADDAGETHEDTGSDDNGHNHSDPPDEPECMEVLEQAQACGGYIEGEWENGEVCTDFDLEETLDSFCPSAEVDKFDYRVADGSGTVEFTDDEMIRDLEIIVDIDVYVPEQCLTTPFGELDCHEVGPMARQYVGLELDCAPPTDPEDPDNPGCECLADEETLDRSYTGGYDVDTDSSLLTLQPEGTRYYYCAEQGVLNMRSVEEGDLPMTESYTFVP